MMSEWTPEEAERIGGVLRRSADLSQIKRRNRNLLHAAIKGVDDMCADIHSRRDEDLPTRAKEFVAGIAASLRNEDAT